MSPYRIASVPAPCRHVWTWDVREWRFDEWVPARIGWTCEKCGAPCGPLRSMWLSFLLVLRNPGSFR